MIGTTNLLPKEVEDLVRRMGLDYTGCSYHLIDRYILYCTVDSQLLETLRQIKKSLSYRKFETNN